MAPGDPLEWEARTLTDLEDIRQLKYRYARAIDLRDFDLLGSLLTVDFEWESHDNAELSKWYTWDRARYLDVVRRKFPASVVSQHHVHHPEIVLDGPNEAAGRWYNEVRILDLDNRLVTSSTSFYIERYRRVSEHWLIARIRYERVFQMEEPLPEAARIVVNRVGRTADAIT